MKSITLEDALNQTPFKPFWLWLDNGRSVHVAHMDCLLFNGPKTVAVVAEGEHILVLDLEHVSALTFSAPVAQTV